MGTKNPRHLSKISGNANGQLKKSVVQENPDEDTLEKTISKTKKDEFNWELCDLLCSHTMYLKDVAEIMKVSEDTIERRIREKDNCTFAEYRSKKMTRTRFNLVFKAIQMARAGDRVMLIFCLKNICRWQDSMPPEPEQIEGVDFV